MRDVSGRSRWFSNARRTAHAVVPVAARTLLLTALSVCVCFTFRCNETLISLLPPSAGPEEAKVLDAKTFPDPVSEWPLAVDALDLRSDNSGTLLGGAMFAKDAVRGGVLVCNGIDGVVRVKDLTAVNFTYAAWIWTNTQSRQGTSTPDGDGLIWADVNPGENDFLLSVLNDRLSYLSYTQDTKGTKLLTDGLWHQVAVTRLDGAMIALYVDGKLDGDGKAGSGGVSANPYVYFCGNPLEGHYFKGLMQDVRYYDRALTPDEILALFSDTRR